MFNKFLSLLNNFKIDKMGTQEFNSAVTTFSNPLKYFALNLTRNDEDAQDLLQDTFLKAMVYKDKFTDATNLKAWLYTIMKNTFINNYRRNQKIQKLVDTTKDLYYINIPQKNNATAPESIIAHKDILSAVCFLQDEYRIPFQRYFDGYKYQEIAEELNIPIGTVKSRIFLARKRLMIDLKDLR